ncbi:MAG: hypothetical protein K9L74_02495 [Candidatus Izimaplasma sp.]|nr:hypothetical protein [Candidatus Izimaplasma bacterium]
MTGQIILIVTITLLSFMSVGRVVRTFLIMKYGREIKGTIVRKELHDDFDLKKYRSVIQYVNQNGEMKYTYDTFTSGNKTRSIGKEVDLLEYQYFGKYKAVPKYAPLVHAIIWLSITIIIISGTLIW